jgi:small subunit ribosomal protein S16
MVVIRLSRGGSKGRPFYDVVVTDSRNARDGQPIERVGYFNPIATSTQVAIHLDLARVNHWKSHGAQMSLTVSRLLKKFLKENPQTAAVA